MHLNIVVFSYVWKLGLSHNSSPVWILGNQFFTVSEEECLLSLKAHLRHRDWNGSNTAWSLPGLCPTMGRDVCQSQPWCCVWNTSCLPGAKGCRRNLPYSVTASMTGWLMSARSLAMSWGQRWLARPPKKSKAELCGRERDWLFRAATPPAGCPPRGTWMSSNWEGACKLLISKCHVCSMVQAFHFFTNGR